jgi:hypothetical protein
VRFAEVEIDQALGADVVIEFDRGWPLIVDRALYRGAGQAGDRPHCDRARGRVTERAAVPVQLRASSTARSLPWWEVNPSM